MSLTTLKKIFTTKETIPSKETIKSFEKEDILNNLEVTNDNIILADVPIAYLDTKTELYKIDEGKYNLLDQEIKNAINQALYVDKKYSHIVRETTIKDQNNNGENFNFEYEYIQQNKAGDCVLSSVANAISLLKGSLPEGGVYNLRNKALSNRIQKNNPSYPPGDILEDDSSLEFYDYIYLIEESLGIGRMFLIDGTQEEIMIEQLLELSDYIQEGKTIFLGLKGHANFIKKIGQNYYLCDSMIDGCVTKFNNLKETLLYIKDNLDRTLTNNFLYISSV